jgi:hypothetical protein
MRCGVLRSGWEYPKPVRDDLPAAETLRYKAAVEELNIPPEMIEELVEMFQANDAAMREVLWQGVKDSPLRK